MANDFGQRWNSYNCVGAIDDKHVRIDPPLKSGSLYYNYKEYFSVVLLAVVDAQFRFMYVDVGANELVIQAYGRNVQLKFILTIIA